MIQSKNLVTKTNYLSCHSIDNNLMDFLNPVYDKVNNPEKYLLSTYEFLGFFICNTYMDLDTEPNIIDKYQIHQILKKGGNLSC